MATLTQVQEKLAAVHTAIMGILDGAQKVSVNGRMYERADLAELVKLEKQLEAAEARLERSNTVRARRVIPIG